MSKKIRRPKINVPAYVKDAAMLAPDSKGRIDRSYIRLMCSAIDTYNRHRSDSLKKVIKDLSDAD